MATHKILVPVDGSEFSKQIFRYIAKLLPPENNELILMRVGERPEAHIGHPPRPASPDVDVDMYETSQDAVEALRPIYLTQEEESAAAELLHEAQADIRALEELGYQVDFEARFGKPGEEIVDYVETHDIDMVAMMTHSRSSIERLIFGSVAEHVSHHVSIPIMLVRPTLT